jgi:hypothetical protein
MILNSINKLKEIIETTPSILNNFSEETFNKKENLNKWSKKEILGHLIDSATNNHQRFVRGQFEDNPKITYDQNNWNKYNFYQEINSKQLIDFWKIYNIQLVEIMNKIEDKNLQKTIDVNEKLLTLEFLIIDYVEHLEHHLKQLIE